MKINCDNCGKSVRKPANYLRLYKNHFCSRTCYFAYRKKHNITTKGMKYDLSQQKTIINLAKERTKREFKPVGYWE